METGAKRLVLVFSAPRKCIRSVRCCSHTTWPFVGRGEIVRPLRPKCASEPCALQLASANFGNLLAPTRNSSQCLARARIRRPVRRKRCRKGVDGLQGNRPCPRLSCGPFGSSVVVARFVVPAAAERASAVLRVPLSLLLLLAAVVAAAAPAASGAALPRTNPSSSPPLRRAATAA